MNREQRFFETGFKYIIFGVVSLNMMSLIILFYPIIDYQMYCLNVDQYTLVEATVLEKRETTLIYGKSRPAVAVTEIQVAINRNGTTQYKTMYTYPEKEVSDNITVAVLGNTVRRCIPYEFTDGDVVYLIGYTLITFVFLASYWIGRKIEKVNEKLETQEINYTIVNDEIDDYMNLENKKKRVMELMAMCSISFENASADKMEIEKQLECSVDMHFIWCLEQFHGSSFRSLIFPFAPKKEEFSWIDVTKTFREQGMPKDCYAISYKDNTLLCCSASDKRIFAYSRYVGITNTKYFDIYDYIIECLEKEINILEMKNKS